MNQRIIDNAKRHIILFFKRHAVLPPSRWLADRVGVAPNDMPSIMRELVDEKFLLENNGYYSINHEITPLKAANDDELKPAIIPISIEGASITEKFIRGVMLIISIIAISVSTYYSFFWLSEFIPGFLALLLSASLVAYATFSFQAVAWLTREGRGLLSAIVLLTAVIVLAFSMLSTIAGQYNARTESINKTDESTEKIQSDKETETLEILRAEEKAIIESIESMEKDIEAAQRALTALEKEAGTWKYNNQAWQLTVLRKKMQEAEKELKDKRTDIKAAIAKNKTVKKETRITFYQWLSTILKIPAGVIEFLLYVFPAVFIDIIAPVGMHIAIGNHRKK